MVWGALLLAQSLGGGLPEIIAKLTDALRHPWVVRWTDKSLLTILVCTGAYVMALALHSAEQGRRRDGAEHGSAAWATPQQVNAQFCQKQNKLLNRQLKLKFSQLLKLLLNQHMRKDLKMMLTLNKNQF